MAKRISIINFKGGVGKTTLAFNLAAGLVRYHQPCRVLLVDVDHQSSLSIVCLGGTEWQKAAREGKTINGIFETFVGQRQYIPGNDIICRNPLGVQHQSLRYRGRASPYQHMDLVPASLQLDDIEIELTASHHGNAILSEWNKRTLVCRWIEETRVNAEYDYIIFDCPPATKIVSQNAIAASHGYIIPVVPEAVMERGAPHLFDMIRNGIDKRLNALALAATGTPRSMHVPETALVGLVVTRIRVHGRQILVTLTITHSIWGRSSGAGTISWWSRSSSTVREFRKRWQRAFLCTKRATPRTSGDAPSTTCTGS